MTSLGVAMTCHNRREGTLDCLDRLLAPGSNECLTLDVVLVDDGSTDGTSEAVKQRHPNVRVVEGNGGLYWARGMSLAQKHVLELGSPDYLLWLNDDTHLLDGRVTSLIDLSCQLADAAGCPVILVGATASTGTSNITYGGSVRKSSLRRFSYQRVWDPNIPVECEVMNGNVVLVPRAIYEAVGEVDAFFEHAMGDTDYALRARRAGFRVFVAPGVAGYCDANPAPAVRHDSAHGFWTKLREFTSRKRLPPRSWAHFTRRHGGPVWFVYFLQPYLKFLIKCLLHVPFRDAIARKS